MLQRRPGVTRVVDPYDDRAGAVAREITHLRVVPVDDEDGVRWKGRCRGAPPLGNVLELPVAVELVAKEVAEAALTRGRTRRAISGRAPSSTSRSPSPASRCARRVGGDA